MGILQNALRKWKENKEEKEGFERQQRIVENFEAKKMSADERELRRFQKEEREKMIKQTLQGFRKKKQDEIWRGKTSNPIHAPNVTVGDKELFNSGSNLFLKKSDLFDRDDLFFRR
jgi:hypothetical protein